MIWYTGPLGAYIVFLTWFYWTWFYWTWFALLVGAELNAELAKESRPGAIAPKNSGATQARKDLRPAA
jgi:uncharacterized BrkB/YihY/UPF0761 family membrane protein